MARIARSLEQLRREVDAAAPGRRKASDGWLGDAAHAARASRHNPNDAGVVCALDVTNDPVGGMPVHELARHMVRRPHPDLEYVISHRQVARRRNGWRWEPYTGANPHTAHAHFAVGRGPDAEPTPPYDTPTPWGVAQALHPEDDMPLTDADLEKIRTLVRAELRRDWENDPTFDRAKAAATNAGVGLQLGKAIARKVGLTQADIDRATEVKP